MINKTTNSIESFCVNADCNFDGFVETLKGTRIEDVECPNCKSKTLKEKIKAGRIRSEVTGE